MIFRAFFAGSAPLRRLSPLQKQKTRYLCNFFAITDSSLDRVPKAGVRAPCQKKVRPPPRIVVTTHRQDRRRPHGHFNRTGDRARGRPAQAGRQHRPERAGPRAPGGLPQRRDVGAGRRAAGRGQPPQRLPRAQSQHVRREDHPAHPEAEGGHLLPRRRAQALLEDGPGHGRGHSRDLPPGAL